MRFDDQACTPADTPLFFSLLPDGEAAAKAICRGCPARLECLDWAIQERMSGVCGGTNEEERRRLIRRRQGVA